MANKAHFFGRWESDFKLLDYYLEVKLSGNWKCWYSFFTKYEGNGHQRWCKERSYEKEKMEFIQEKTQGKKWK